MAYDTIEEKLRALAGCGFRLKDQFELSYLLDSWGREALDEPGFDLALACLGMTEECSPWTPHCENLWHFDSECIEGHGSYVDIGERMAEMAQGSLLLSDFRDYVNIAEGKAWLEFKCQSATVHIDCLVRNDWVDKSILGVFVSLLSVHDNDKIFFVINKDDQDCIIGCTVRCQFDQLKKLMPNAEALK